ERVAVVMNLRAHAAVDGDVELRDTTAVGGANRFVMTEVPRLGGAHQEQRTHRNRQDWGLAHGPLNTTRPSSRRTPQRPKSREPREETQVERQTPSAWSEERDTRPPAT